MGLVSSIYRMAPSAGYISKDEGETRLKLKIRRLVSQYGQDEVIRRIRIVSLPEDMEIIRAWLVLTAMAAPAKESGTTPEIPPSIA